MHLLPVWRCVLHIKHLLVLCVLLVLYIKHLLILPAKASSATFTARLLLLVRLLVRLLIWLLRHEWLRLEASSATFTAPAKASAIWLWLVHGPRLVRLLVWLWLEAPAKSSAKSSAITSISASHKGVRRSLVRGGLLEAATAFSITAGEGHWWPRLWLRRSNMKGRRCWLVGKSELAFFAHGLGCGSAH